MRRTPRSETTGNAHHKQTSSWASPEWSLARAVIQYRPLHRAAGEIRYALSVLPCQHASQLSRPPPISLFCQAAVRVASATAKSARERGFCRWGRGGSPVRALVWTIVRVNAPPNQIDCMHLYCCCCCCCMSAVGLGILFQLTGWPVVRGKLFWYCTLHLHMCAYASPRVLCCIVHESCIVRVVVFFRSQQHVTAFNPSFVDSSN